MIDHARSELPNECCGALAGTEPLGGICRIERCYPLINTLASPREYDVEMKGLLKAIKEARNLNLEIFGFYHSHPTSAPIPSKKDREKSWWGDGVVHFIISLEKEEAQVRGWHLTAEKHWEALWEIRDSDLE